MAEATTTTDAGGGAGSDTTDTGAGTGAGDEHVDDTTTTDTTDWKAMSRRHERERKRLEGELAKAKAAVQTDADKALEQAREEAAKAVRDEVGAELATARLELAVLKSEGAKKLADPADALRFINRDDVTDDDGNVDEKELAVKVKALLAERPYLAASGDRVPGVPTGARGGTSTGSDMNAALRRAAGRA